MLAQTSASNQYEVRNQFKRVSQGDSVPFSFSLCAEDTKGWECRIVVKRFPWDKPYIEREIEPNTCTHSWVGALTSEETQSLGEGPYRLIGVLTNPTTGEEEQIINHYRFNVTRTWAA